MSRFLRYGDLKSLKGIPFSRQHIRRLQKVLKFPLSVSFGDNTEVFIEEEIDRWTADRIAERDTKAAALAAQQQETAGLPRQSRNKYGSEHTPQHQEPAQQRRSEQRPKSAR